MPYEWTVEDGAETLHVWPHRSLPKRGFVAMIVVFVAGALVPLVSVLGTVVLWGVLPFFLLVLWALWAAVQRSYRDGTVLEVLTLRPRVMRLERHDPGGAIQSWEAHPHWVQIEVHRQHRVPGYVTLRGGPREVELGAFLTPDERRDMAEDLAFRLSQLRES